MEITNLQQLQTYAQGQVVQFPDFAEGQPFVARIKRPSMLALAKANKIPNALLQTANNMFSGRGVSEKKETALSDLFQVLDVLCEACFVEPTFAQIKESGIQLTDEQLMFVFKYSQEGVKALETFRVQSPHNVGTGASAKV